MDGFETSNSTLILSRYLYAIDEVIISFIDSLLRKDSGQALWWFFEYYFSVIPEQPGDGINVDNRPSKLPWQLLYKVYYDYYAIHYPSIERKMAKQYETWESIWTNTAISYTEKYNKSVEPLISCILNLSRRKASFDVFVLRQSYHKTNTSKKSPYRFPSQQMLARHAKKGWLANTFYPVGYYGILWAIHTREWHNVCYYLRKLMENPEVSPFDLYLKIIHYFMVQEAVNINADEAEIKNQWDKIMTIYQDNWHVILCGIAYFAKWPEGSSLIPNVNIMNIIANPELKTDEKVLMWNSLRDNLWETLQHRRMYPVVSGIELFETARNNMKYEDFVEAYRMKWDKYCARCPVWRERISRYLGEISFDGSVKFANPDKEEAFYEAYFLEPDEQPLKTQLYSIGKYTVEHEDSHGYGEGEGKKNDEYLKTWSNIENTHNCGDGEVIYMPKSGDFDSKMIV